MHSQEDITTVAFDPNPADPTEEVFPDEAQQSMSADILDSASPPSDQDEEPKQSPNEEAQDEQTASGANRRIVDRAMAAKIYEEQRRSRQSAASDVLIFDSAIKNKRILESTVGSVITENREVYCVCYEGNVDVLIPYSEFYMVLEKELLADQRPQTLERQRQLMTRSIGISTPFIVESMIKNPDGDGYIAYASRRQALERWRKVRYFGETATRRVEQGSNVMAQIISVGPNAAWVNTCGMDIRVPNYLLSYRFIFDVAADYYIGQEIQMRVMRIVENPADQFCPQVYLSALPVELQKYKANARRIRGEHARFGAVVTSLRTNPETGRVTVQLFLEAIEVPAYASTAQLSLRDDLRSGDKVLFEAWGARDNGMVYGSIIRYVHGRRR